LQFPRTKTLFPNTYAFSIEESVAIIQTAKEPWKTLFRIVAETGVRSGEVAGLRIEDFDPINITLAVRQSVWNNIIQTTKTANAVRRQPISAELGAAIQRVIDGQLEFERLLSSPDRKERRKGRANPHRLIFTGQTGQPLQMSHFINRVFRPILEELGIRAKLAAMGIDRCGLHAFRRMSATQMDEQGVPMRTRQDRMGHASITTTMEHYTKPIDEASRKFANRMGMLLNPKCAPDSLTPPPHREPSDNVFSPKIDHLLESLSSIARMFQESGEDPAAIDQAVRTAIRRGESESTRTARAN
jgi:integrase